MEKTVVELFAGVGGFRCGLNNVELKNNKVIENGNWKFVWANQWEPATKSQDAFDCYTKRFGLDETTSNKDIHIVNKKTIPNHTLLVGGFPCQDYSVARTLANGKGIEGKKGVLWWDIVDILKAKKPPFVLLENVDRLLISPANQRGRDFGIMLRTFADNGYAVEWRVINAGEYGLPQKRRRIFIFAFHKSTNYYKNIKKIKMDDMLLEKGIFAKQFPVAKKEIESISIDISKDVYKDLVELSNKLRISFYKAGFMINGLVHTTRVNEISNNVCPLKNIIEKKEVDSKYFLSKDAIKKFEKLKGAKKIPRVKPNGEVYNYSEGAMAFPDNLNSPARTMLTSESSINRSTHVVEDAKTKKLRLITPVEAERINGFPDNWTNTGMVEKRRYFMMGNALVVGIINKVGVELSEIIKKEV